MLPIPVKSEMLAKGKDVGRPIRRARPIRLAGVAALTALALAAAGCGSSTSPSSGNNPAV